MEGRKSVVSLFRISKVSLALWAGALSCSTINKTQSWDCRFLITGRIC